MSQQLRYALFGAAFGLCFPLGALVFISLTEHIGIGAVGEAHARVPLLWMIDSAPVFLGLFASFAGRKQDQLAAHLHQLEGRIRDRTAGLEQARDQALAADRAKDRFLETMSNEVRAPLSSITGFGKALLARGNLDELQRKQLQSIITSSVKLSDVLEDVLEVTEGTSPGIEPMGPAPVVPVLQRAAEHMRRADRPDITVATSPSGTAICDPKRLGRAVEKLIAASFELSPKGEIVLSVQKPDNSSYPMAVELKCNGIGISRHELEEIIGAFKQVEQGNSQGLKGGALNLTFARALCSSMGYDLLMESDPARGMTFRIRFPSDCVPN